VNPDLEHRPPRYGLAIVAGIGLIAAGVILGLRNAGFHVPISLSQFWPLLLVLLGVAKLSSRPLRVGGHVLVFLGIFFLAIQAQPLLALRYGPPAGLLWLGVIITLRALLPSTPRTDRPLESQDFPRAAP
jgi:hypothetical protein